MIRCYFPERMVYPIFILVAGLLWIATASAQRLPCASMQILERQQQAYPELVQRMASSETRIATWIGADADHRSGPEWITIPVVVHVLWHQIEQNISDEQILSQLEILNEDFRKLNPDSLQANHPFWPFSANTGIGFCLAAEDASGNPVSGITRTQTSVDVWDWTNFTNIKSTENGGMDNWDPTRYLNIYVVNMDGLALGFSSFPDVLLVEPDRDGVVIHFQAFGREGTAGEGGFGANARGRTATHEIGHWLNLQHIWGNASCGDDLVADTPGHESPFGNYGCPTFPFNAFNLCGSDQYGEMFMNFMDYTADTCMAMFSKGQSDRMLATLNLLRTGILNNTICQPPASTGTLTGKSGLSIAPNPSDGQVTLTLDPGTTGEPCPARLFDLLGDLAMDLGQISPGATSIHLGGLPPGYYWLQWIQNDRMLTAPLIIAR